MNPRTLSATVLVGVLLWLGLFFAGRALFPHIAALYTDIAHALEQYL